MKHIKKYEKINESYVEKTMIENMFKFYSEKHPTDNSKFIDMILSLIDKGDISEESFEEFCMEQGIDLEDKIITKFAEAKKKKEEAKRQRSYYSSGGCGTSTNNNWRASSC